MSDESETLAEMGLVDRDDEEAQAPVIGISLRRNSSFLENKDSLVAEAANKLIIGLPESSVRSSLKADGLDKEQIYQVLAEAKKEKSAAIKAAKTKTKEELLAAAYVLLDKAVAGDKLDIAHKILRTISELSEKTVPNLGIVFDPLNPQNYMQQLLDAQGRGADIPPTVMAATARAVSAWKQVIPQPDDDESSSDDVEEPDLNNPEAASKYAMYLINGGKPGVQKA